MAENKKKVSRSKKASPVVEVETDDIVNEQSIPRLDMANKNLTIEDMTSRWESTFRRIQEYSDRLDQAGRKNSIGPTMTKWNSLNPFLQNQRIKNLFVQPGTFSKTDLGGFLANPAGAESQLRASAWASSSSQQIYYNILRRACDIPQYKYFVIPELLDSDAEYKSKSFKEEDRLVNDWLELFNVPGSLKTMALQIKREGKQSYLLRSRIDGEGDKRQVGFAAFEKLPSNWIKITGIGQFGYTVSFNMMYFLNPANNPAYFGDFMVKAWNDMTKKEVVSVDPKTKQGVINLENARNYSFLYQGQVLSSSLEMERIKRQDTYMFWLKMPYDICFTFGSDNSHAWCAPDTMGLLMKLQELTDYGTLAGLIASTPLTAILTGEAEYIDNARAAKNETKISPEVLKGLQDLFNATTSTNVEAMFFPLKNIKLQQLNADVNSSEIISTATENFVATAGEGGLTITTSKPNVSQIKTAQLLAASQQRYVTVQFEAALNFIIQKKLGLKYKWKLRLWGDIFSFDGEKKYLKEMVSGGNSALLPKLMSAEDISLRDTKSIVSYLKTLDFYKEFQTFTMVRQNKLNVLNSKSEKTEDETGRSVGRPPLDDSEIENDATAKSRDDGTNTRDNRDTLSLKCPVCGEDIEEGQIVCDDCAQEIIEQLEDK